MPLQNRVDPFGNIHAVPYSGTRMGNRGILHDDRRRLRHYHCHKNWVICRLEFKDRQRIPMSPGNYTELFFLDEATALAAGHRPCGECSRERYKEFVRLWRQANPNEPGAIDHVLHRQRFVPHRKHWWEKKLTCTLPITDLPLGTFIVLDAEGEATPYLVKDNSLYPWSFAGYGGPLKRPNQGEVTVLTPLSTVLTLSAGYQPQLHPSVKNHKK